jgi:hypothetical protein
LLQGLLFVAVAPFMGEIKPNERQKTVLIELSIVVVGTVVCSVLSMLVGAARANQPSSK